MSDSSLLFHHWKSACEEESDTDRTHISRSPGRGNSGGPPSRTTSKSPLPPGCETRNRLESSANKFNEVELKQKILALEDTVYAYERQKNSVMGTFQEFRERLVDKERTLEAEYSSKIISLSEEVLSAKRDFEARMKEYQAAQEKYEREKEQALEKLKQQHQKEIQSLEKRCSDSQLLHLEQKYMVEIQRLEEERKSLKFEKERLSESFECRLRRAQSLYETELNAAKALYKSELDALKDHESALREELVARQEEFKDRLEDLTVQFKESKTELDKSKHELSDLERRLKKKEGEVSVITKELRDTKHTNDDLAVKLQHLKDEVHNRNQRYQEHQEQFTRKSDLIVGLEQAKTKLEACIEDLTIELRSLKRKVSFLENERKALEVESRTQNELQQSQLNALQTLMENINQEKEKVKEDYELKLEQERMESENKLLKAEKQYNQKWTEFTKSNDQYKILQDQLKAKSAEMDTMKEKFGKDKQKELTALIEEKLELQSRVSKLEEALKSGAPENTMLATLKQDLATKEKKLYTANQMVETLNDTSSKLLNQIDSLQEKVNCMSKAQNIPVSTNAEELKKELREIVESELEQQWQQKLETAVEKAKEEGCAHHKHELIIPEIQIDGENWVEEKKELLSEIDNLRTELQETERNSAFSSPQNVNDVEEVQELNKTIEDLTTTVEQLTTRIQELEGVKSNIDSSELLEKRNSENKKLQKVLAKLREELVDQKNMDAAEIEKLSDQIKSYENRLKDVDTMRESDGSDMENTFELESQLKSKGDNLKGLESTIETMQSKMDDITTELQQKTQRIEDIQRETKEYIRKREEQQNKAHKRELENIRNEYNNRIHTHESTELKLRQELNTTNAKSNASSSTVHQTNVQDSVRSPTTSTASLSDEEGLKSQVDTLHAELETRTEEMNRLQDERAHLEDELSKIKKRKDSSDSSAVVSADTERKRGSVSSSCSSGRGEPPSSQLIGGAKKNSALIQRWQCLVKQATEVCRRDCKQPQERPPCSRANCRENHTASGTHQHPTTSSQSSRRGSMAASKENLTHSRSSMPRGHKNSIDNSDSIRDSREELDEDDEEIEGRIGRLTTRTPSSSSLRPPDSRRSAKSPSRSPAPCSKTVAPILPIKQPMPISKRPAWRI